MFTYKSKHLYKLNVINAISINDKETNQIIRIVKELFMKNVNNSQSLGQLIDKYLVPQELEKKSNAEVSTHYKLREEMLDKILKEFWSEYYVIDKEIGK
jgi:hypothetical protein